MCADMRVDIDAPPERWRDSFRSSRRAQPCIVMAQIVIDYIDMACILMAHIVLASIGLAYKVMACIVMACTVMAHVVIPYHNYLLTSA